LKKNLNILISISVISFFLSCSLKESPHQNHKLIIGVGGTLNLGKANPVLIQRNANVWETFTCMDDSLIPRPSLAESIYLAENGRDWIMKLRGNVLFQNGDTLNVKLAEENILRYKKHPELDYYGMYSNLDSLKAIDNYTIKLFFAKPCNDLPNKIGHYFAGIFSPESFDSEGKIINPVGCGPYIFVESKPGEYDLFKAFNSYYKGKPYFDTVEFRIIPVPLVRVMSLLKGDIDMIAHHGGLHSSHLDLIKNNSKIVIDSSDVAITHYMLYNCARKPFSDKNARTAFDRFIDRYGLVNVILKGKGIPAHDYFVDRAYLWDNKRFNILPDTSLSATEELKRFIGGKPIEMVLAQGDISSWDYRRVSDYIADYFSRFGIIIKIKSLEGGAWQKTTAEGNYDITLYPLSIPTGTPELFIRRLAYSTGMKVTRKGNTTNYKSAIVDSMLDKALNDDDPENQKKAFNLILDKLAEDKPVTPLFHEKYYFAYRSNIKNVHIDPFLKLDLSVIAGDGVK
jgi:peptide/nickel transport system substrate-binding protein